MKQLMDEPGGNRLPALMRKWSCLLGLPVFLLLLSCNGSKSRGKKLGADLDIPDSVEINLKDPQRESEQPKKKRIFMTFDDGPNLGTRNLLTILKEEKVPATMFLIGQHTRASTEQKLMWQELQTFPGIELFNHSYSHAWRNHFTGFYKNTDSIISDFNRAQAMMMLKEPIARTPGRNTWRIDSTSRTDLLKNKPVIDSLQKKGGYVLIGWDLEWQFNHKNAQPIQTPDQLMAQVDHLFASNKTLKPDNLVILAHDQMWRSSADSLRLHEFIRKLKSRQGYELALITDYPGVKEALANQKRF
ncbi:polysaccharide deacetylase family protein [Niabella hirudinis]|uniref:polysaccharide deacetylase family protein n=1 Tax=Niabella hirudinis TaxID=1285929 RepID=UPI003EBC4216